jgi:hypothetical protein
MIPHESANDQLIEDACNRFDVYYHHSSMQLLPLSCDSHRLLDSLTHAINDELYACF